MRIKKMRKNRFKKHRLFFTTNSLLDQENVETAYKHMADVEEMKRNLNVGDCIKVKYRDPERKSNTRFVTETIKVLQIFSNWVLFEKENGIRISFLWHDIWQIWKRKGVIEEW